MEFDILVSAMFELDESQSPPQWIRWLLAAFIAVAFACGSSEYQTPVGNGHEICRIHGTGIFVTGDGGEGFLVPPNIEDFRVEGHLLVGRLGPPETRSYQWPDRSGYFVADTRTGTAALELTASQWREQLVTNGLPHDLSVSGIPWRYNTSPVAMLARWIVLIALAFGVVVLTLNAIIRTLRRPKGAA